MSGAGQKFQSDGLRNLLAWVVTRTSGVPLHDTFVVVFIAQDSGGCDVAVEPITALELRAISVADLTTLRATAVLTRAVKAVLVVFDPDPDVAETVSTAVALNLHLDTVRVHVAGTEWHELGIGSAYGEHGLVADLASSSMAAQMVVAGLPFPLLSAR